MLLLKASPPGLFPRVLSLVADNQPKFLSMSMLHKNSGSFNQAWSGPIKPNQIIF
jgi:hypothetical protein